MTIRPTARQTNEVARAAGLLRAARRPLVMGLGGVSTEAQRVAVAIADRLGGVADWTTGPADAADVIALQTVGAVGATYGEAGERGDLILYWRCPANPLPDFDTIGDTSSREVIEIGVDEFPLKPGADYEALSVLRAIRAGIELDAAAIEQATGVPLASWRGLIERLQASSYAVIVKDNSLIAEGHATLAALTQLGQELHQTTRVAIVSPLSTGNRPGAENVLAWQTGYPLAVCFAAGYPRYGPGEFDAQTLLERGEVDAALIVDNNDVPNLSGAARNHLESIPRVVLSHRENDDGVEVCFKTEPLSQSQGTYYRADGIALTLPGIGATAQTSLHLILEELNRE